MAFPFVDVFLILLAAYLVYSAWAGIDGRYPIAAALVLLVGTAVVDATGASDTANTLAEFAFFLLSGGVLLLLYEHVRAARKGRSPPADNSVRDSVAEREPGQAPHERDRSS